ncbi:hypothetical protein L7F22_048133 [Adiantum nelumboides]|nr:hypothetical protein [Adiantum nelumboides]
MQSHVGLEGTGILDRLTYDGYVAKHFACMAKVAQDVEPTCFEEAAENDKWQEAMNEEMDTLYGNETWELAPLPKGKKPIGCRWVYKVKHNNDGSVSRYKARLVAKGYAQTYGIDYEETFAPVAKMATIRAVIAKVEAKGWILDQMDTKNAFLHGDLQEEMYMEQPPGYQDTGHPNYVYADHSLYVHKTDAGIVIITIYVNNLIVGGDALKDVEHVKALLHKQFDMKDLGELCYFLGIEMIRNEGGIWLSQKKYGLDMLMKYGMADWDSVLVDKVLQPLDALLQQWEARLNNTQTLEQRWLLYPYPEIETKRLEMCKDLIRVAQALMEPYVVRAPEQEVLTQKEIEKQGDKEPELVMGPKPDTHLPLEHRVVPNTTDKDTTMEVMPIPEVEEPSPQSLWETIKNRKDGNATLQSASIQEVVLNIEFYPGDIQSLYGDAGMEVSMDSKPPSLKTLPSFIGKHEAKSEIRIVPSQQRATPKMIDSKGLQEMLFISVTCTITLSKLLKIRPHLWEEMGKHLETKEIKIPIYTNPPREEKQNGNQQKAQRVPINKVGDYCEDEEDNTTLPVEYNEIKTIAILYSGARVAIATK